MKAKEIVELLNAKAIYIYDESLLEKDYNFAFSSDLMSDCLALISHNQSELVLLTGLCNIQSLRTAEMLDIDFLVITRGKKLDQEILESISEFNINTFSTAYTSFEASGILYTNGIKATDVDKEILS
ncbi:MAG: hypothetical protein IJH31_07860 [Erysipelotrichaceae bacterium]|nr:hypothetical protein [Erysipelotrichaceae bacterium]